MHSGLIFLEIAEVSPLKLEITVEKFVDKLIFQMPARSDDPISAEVLTLRVDYK